MLKNNIGIWILVLIIICPCLPLEEQGRKLSKEKEDSLQDNPQDNVVLLSDDEEVDSDKILTNDEQSSTGKKSYNTYYIYLLKNNYYLY